MNWFRIQPKPIMCVQCERYFAPHKDGGPFQDLCKEHREKPLLDWESRKRIALWAKREGYEDCKKAYDAWQIAEIERRRHMSQVYGNMRNQANAQAQYSQNDAMNAMW